MTKRVRLAIAIILLSVSIYLLIWGYLPNPREMRERNIPPAELQLPTPSSLYFEVRSALNPNPETVS